MEFGWDTAKNAWNVRQRRLPFALAALLFSGPTLEWEDDRIDYGEARSKGARAWSMVGCCCASTPTASSLAATVRWLISLREAERVA
jgi:uncharacterized DUF497 family protein